MCYLESIKELKTLKKHSEEIKTLFHWRKSEPGENQTVDEGNKKIKGKKQDLWAPPSSESKRQSFPSPGFKASRMGSTGGILLNSWFEGSILQLQNQKLWGTELKNVHFLKVPAY